MVRIIIKPLIMAILSLFFLIFGLTILVGAYHLNNPLEFIMAFFSSSLIILISAVGIGTAVMRLYRGLCPLPREYDHDR